MQYGSGIEMERYGFPLFYFVFAYFKVSAQKFNPDMFLKFGVYPQTEGIILRLNPQSSGKSSRIMI